MIIKTIFDVVDDGFYLIDAAKLVMLQYYAIKATELTDFNIYCYYVMFKALLNFFSEISLIVH